MHMQNGMNDVLPKEILIRIFSFLDSVTQKRLFSVCCLWNQILQSFPVLSQVMVSVISDTDSVRKATGCGHNNCAAASRSLARLIQPTTKRLIIAHRDAQWKTKSFKSAFKLCQLTCRNTFHGNFPQRLLCLKLVVLDGVSVHFIGLLELLPTLPATLRHVVLKNVVFDHFAFLPDNRYAYRGKIVRNGKLTSGIGLYTIETPHAQILPARSLPEAKEKLWNAIESEGAMKPLDNSEAVQLEALLKQGLERDINQHFYEIIMRTEPAYAHIDPKECDFKIFKTVTQRELYTAVCLQFCP